MFFAVAFNSKLKAQSHYILYSNKSIDHEINDTCKAEIKSEIKALVLYSRKDIDTLYFQEKGKAQLYRYKIGKLLTNGYFLLINNKYIYLRNGIKGLSEYENKYEIQHYSHGAHSSHASHASAL